MLKACEMVTSRPHNSYPVKFILKDFLARCVQVPVGAVGQTGFVLVTALAEKNPEGGFLP